MAKVDLARSSREALVVALEVIGVLVVAAIIGLGVVTYLELQERRRSGAEKPRE